MTCFLESVHTDQCSRHWSDFEHTSLLFPKSVRQVTVSMPSFVISFPPAHVHASSRRDSGVSSTQVRHDFLARHTLNSTAVEDSCPCPTCQTRILVPLPRLPLMVSRMLSAFLVSTLKASSFRGTSCR